MDGCICGTMWWDVRVVSELGIWKEEDVPMDRRV